MILILCDQEMRRPQHQHQKNWPQREMEPQLLVAVPSSDYTRLDTADVMISVPNCNCVRTSIHIMYMLLML